jgi:hypothetical protein
MFDCDGKKCWDEKGTTCEEKWAELFNDCCEKNISVVKLLKVSEFIFCSPETSAPVECLFSIMNYVWSLDCSPMLGSRVQALLFCKY